MSSSTRQNRPELTDIVSNLDRLVRSQTRTTDAAGMEPCQTDEDCNERSQDPWLVEAQKADDQDDNDDGNYQQSHSTVEDEDESEIVLTRRELKAMLKMATKNTLTMVDDRIVEVMWSCADGSAPSPVGAAVSIALETMIDKILWKNTIQAVVRDTMERMISESHVVTTTADQLTQTESLMVAITTFVSNVVNKRVEEATRTQIKAKKEVALPPSPPSPEPSD